MSHLTGGQQSMSSVFMSVSHSFLFSSHLNAKVRLCVS